MTASDADEFSSKLPWPKGAIQDWQHGMSHGDIAKKYGRCKSSVQKQIHRAKMLGTPRVVELAKRNKGGTKRYLDQAPLSAAHAAVGIKLNRYRELERGLNYEQVGKLLNTNRLTARKMELGIHDASLSELMKIGELLGQPIEDLIKPATVRK